MCDPCVYVKNDSSSKVFIVLYVDDLLVTGSSELGISKTKAVLISKLAMKDLKYVSLILGMQVSRDRLKSTLNINQGNYVKASAAIRVCRQQMRKHTRHWKTPGPKTRSSAGRWQQAAIPRNCGKSHLLIDVQAGTLLHP